MAIQHALSGQPVDVRPLGDAITTAQTVALFKSQNLELMRLVLPKGKLFPPHSVKGDVTLQCIEGELAVTAEGATTRLLPGQLIYLAGGVLHGVSAHVDSSALMTIALCR